MIFKNSKVYDLLLKLLKYGIPAICFVLNGFAAAYGWQICTYIATGVAIVGEGLAIFLGVSKSKYKMLTEIGDDI